MERVEVVVAHRDGATLRVGDTFLKVDGDRARADREVAAMALAPVPTPTVLWRTAPVLALAALPGAALGRLGTPSPAPATAWSATGAMLRRLHDAPLPPWPGRARDTAALTAELDDGCAWLLDHDVLPATIVECNRALATAALAPRPPVFAHGDLQVAHVFIDDDAVTGVIDWTEAGPGDALYDLACLTLVHQEHLADVVRGYGDEVDTDVVRAWWSFRSLTAVRWLVEHGFDPDPTAGRDDPWPRSELDVLRHAAGVTGPRRRP